MEHEEGFGVWAPRTTPTAGVSEREGMWMKGTTGGYQEKLAQAAALRGEEIFTPFLHFFIFKNTSYIGITHTQSGTLKE